MRAAATFDRFEMLMEGGVRELEHINGGHERKVGQCLEALIWSHYHFELPMTWSKSRSHTLHRRAKVGVSVCRILRYTRFQFDVQMLCNIWNDMTSCNTRWTLTVVHCVRNKSWPILKHIQCFLGGEKTVGKHKYHIHQMRFKLGSLYFVADLFSLF